MRKGILLCVLGLFACIIAVAAAACHVSFLFWMAGLTLIVLGLTLMFGEPKPAIDLDFSEDAHERLEQIRKDTGSKTFTELVRNALRTYDWLEAQKKQGYTLCLMKDDVIKSVELRLD